MHCSNGKIMCLSNYLAFTESIEFIIKNYNKCTTNVKNPSFIY